MRKPLFLGTLLIALPLGALAARLAPGAPPAMAPADQQADRIVVSKAGRSLSLMRGETVLKTDRIWMGAAWDDGNKQAEGDERMPEGNYVIDWRNPRSIARICRCMSLTPMPRTRRGRRRRGFLPVAIS